MQSVSFLVIFGSTLSGYVLLKVKQVSEYGLYMTVRIVNQKPAKTDKRCFTLNTLLYRLMVYRK